VRLCIKLSTSNCTLATKEARSSSTSDFTRR